MVPVSCQNGEVSTPWTTSTHGWQYSIWCLSLSTPITFWGLLFISLFTVSWTIQMDPGRSKGTDWTQPIRISLGIGAQIFGRGPCRTSKCLKHANNKIHQILESKKWIWPSLSPKLSGWWGKRGRENLDLAPSYMFSPSLSWCPFEKLASWTKSVSKMTMCRCFPVAHNPKGLRLGFLSPSPCPRLNSPNPQMASELVHLHSYFTIKISYSIANA